MKEPELINPGFINPDIFYGFNYLSNALQLFK